MDLLYDLFLYLGGAAFFIFVPSFALYNLVYRDGVFTVGASIKSYLKASI